jgi:hypothetical protein
MFSSVFQQTDSAVSHLLNHKRYSLVTELSFLLFAVFQPELKAIRPSGGAFEDADRQVLRGCPTYLSLKPGIGMIKDAVIYLSRSNRNAE